MYALELLNNVPKSRYMPFKELKHGKYVINGFFITEDKYSQTLLCAKLGGDQRYVILPKRFSELLQSSTLEKLNSEKMVLVFNVKKTIMTSILHLKLMMNIPLMVM